MEATRMLSEKMKCWGAVFALLLLTLTNNARAQTNGSGSDFDYSLDAQTAEITLTNYTGTNTSLDIPATINGLTVVAIGDGSGSVFGTGLTNVTVPQGVK